MSNTDAPRIMIDSYLEWLKNEGIPVTEDFGVDLFKVETRPWARFGVNGAAVHLKGRGDFVNMFMLDIPPAEATAPIQHLYEEVVFVLAGQGSTTIEVADGRKHTFEWGPKSMFALPLNTKYRHFNGSGSERALLVSTTNMPAIMNMFHNEKFIFSNYWQFDERMGDSKYFSGEGDFIAYSSDNPVWETNFVPDLSAIELKPWVARGGGSSTLKFILADSPMHAHTSEMPVGKYKKGHRHGADLHVMCVTGTGYSLLWYEGEPDFHRVDWSYGTVFAPPDQMFHQHFNTSAVPARYLATGLGSQRYPVTESKRKTMFGGVSTSVKKGGDQIEYEDQSPRIHSMYVEETKKNGVIVDKP
jgi:mannose-6-phosphate isomerase-like protein (cupin superfamily)